MCVFPRNIVESGSRARRGAVPASLGSEAGTNRKRNLQQDPAAEDSELFPLRSPGFERGGRSLAAGLWRTPPSVWPSRTGAILVGLQTPPPPPSLLVVAQHPTLACHSAARPWILPLPAAQGLGVTNLCPRA